MQPPAAQLFTSTVPDMKKAIRLDIMYPTQPHFLWFKKKSLLIASPLWPKGMLYFFIALLLWKNKVCWPACLWKCKGGGGVHVDNLLHKEDQQLSLSLEFKVPQSDLLPVVTWAVPSYNLDYWRITWREEYISSRTPVTRTLRPSSLCVLISHCVGLHYYISKQTKRQISFWSVFMEVIFCVT